MASVITLGEATNLGLPGRHSLEIVSGKQGADSMTLRLVEIAIQKPGEPPRKLHCHPDIEECIYVLSGQATTQADSGNYPLKTGDTILIPSGEWHVTHNTGSEPLKLLCFFPVPEVEYKTMNDQDDSQR